MCFNPCRCEATKVVKIHINEDHIMHFLTRLNDQFSIVKTQILLLDPLPTLNKVYTLVKKEECNFLSYSYECF